MTARCPCCTCRHSGGDVGCTAHERPRVQAWIDEWNDSPPRKCDGVWTCPPLDIDTCPAWSPQVATDVAAEQVPLWG